MTAPRKTNKPIDWPAVLTRCARGGLHFVDLADPIDWDRAIGSDARVVADGDTIWLSHRARVQDVEQALQALDPNNYSYLRVPVGPVYIGASPSAPANTK